MNNLAEVLKALRELNFILANRAPELALYYNMELPPRQIKAEVPDLVRAHLNCNTAYNAEYSARGRPRSRGNQHQWYSWQSSPKPRYNQHSERSENHFYSNRNYSNTYHHSTSQHNSPNTVRNTPSTGNNPVNVLATQSPNNSNIIESFQSQILGLKTQALQQSTLNSIKIFDSNNKSEFTSWAQSVENVAQLCNLDALTIMLFELQGPPLQSAHFLKKKKEISSGKQLNWHSLKKHLTTNYSEIPYDMHAINAYDSLHQASSESTSAYLHRVQDILECIHNTSDMTSIAAIGTNHPKNLTGLRDSRLHNKLAESNAKKWTTMSQVLQDVADMPIDFERSCWYSLPTFEVQYVSSANSSSSYRSNKPTTRNVQQMSN